MNNIKTQIKKLYNLQQHVENPDDNLLVTKYFNWIMGGLYLQEVYKNIFKKSGKWITIDDEDFKLSPIDFFMKHYGVDSNTKFVIETMDSIEEIRILINNGMKPNKLVNITNDGDQIRFMKLDKFL